MLYVVYTYSTCTLLTSTAMPKPSQAPMDPHWFQIVQVSDNQDLAKVSVDGMPFWVNGSSTPQPRSSAIGPLLNSDILRFAYRLTASIRLTEGFKNGFEHTPWNSHGTPKIAEEYFPIGHGHTHGFHGKFTEHQRGWWQEHVIIYLG